MNVTDEMIRAGIEAAPGVRFEHIERIITAALSVNTPPPSSQAPEIDWFETCLNVVHEHKRSYVVTRDDLRQRGKANASLYANFVEVCDSISEAIHALRAMPDPTPSPQPREVGHD